MNLILVIHCHQPVGNFDVVFEQAHEKCYRPFLDLLQEHAAIKLGLHLSGPLLEWLEGHQPKTLELLRDLIERDQVEPFSGGFFEPLLASIPAKDARGQVQMMNDYIERRFGRKPSGFWLTERIWDPALPLTLSGTGMRYTVVDDTHFYYAGLRAEDIHGAYVTEREGHPMHLLATPMVMRYLIPFKPVEEVIGHLRAWHDQDKTVAVYGDDGEKFGVWPGTHEWVIQKGWLDRFFAAIEENGDWLNTTLPRDFVEAHRPLGRLYLPQASYEEMTQWALPPEQTQALEDMIANLKDQGRWDAWRAFVRGGVWDNFLVKYDEANRMHKKMIFLSRHLDHDPDALQSLWRGQCNCAYWHGVFGGLYLGHLRRAVYENLLHAQAGLAKGPKDQPHLERLDFDKDGTEEILIWDETLSLGLSPGRGGALFEIAHISKALNLTDILTRRPEAYHRRLREKHIGKETHGEGAVSIHDLAQTRDKDLEALLVYDPYTRLSLLDHFLPPEISPEVYAGNGYEDTGDFIQGAFQVHRTEISAGTGLVELHRAGRIGSSVMDITKALHFERGGRLWADYHFHWKGEESLSILYGCEFNLNLYSDQDHARYMVMPDKGRRREIYETGREDQVTRLNLVNGPDGLTAAFSFSNPLSVFFFPLITVSQSETAFERTYQGSSLLFLYPLGLDPHEEARLQIRLELIQT